MKKNNLKQGIYYPDNPLKYKGNVRNIAYRSGWEKRFMVYLDIQPNVLSWSSEEIAIPYWSPIDKQRHRYYPDFWVKLRKPDGSIKEMIIEIKPLAQTKQPKPKKRVTKRLIEEVMTYAVNDAKWQAARQYCKDRKMEFKIMTEKELGI